MIQRSSGIAIAVRYLLKAAGVSRRIGFEETRFVTLTAPFNASAHEVDRYLSLVN